MTARRRLASAAVALGVVSGCVAEAPVGATTDPPPQGPQVLEAALAGRSEPVDAAVAAAPDALREHLALLAAVVEPSRERRLARLEALADDADDPLLARTASHLLEQDDAWLAAALEGERFESAWTSLADGLLRTVGAAVQGNPIGAARPLVEGVDGLLRPDELDALDRKQLALSRRWLVTHPHGAGLPVGAAAVEARSEELRAAVFRQELRLFDRLLDEGRTDAAAAHLHVASVRRPHADEVTERAASLEAAAERAATRDREAVRVAPKEVELRLVDPEGFAACRRLAEEVLLGRAGAERCAAFAAAAESEGWPEVARSLRRAAASWTPVDPWTDVAAAEEEVGARRWRYVLTGARPQDDPAERYRAAADPGGFRAADLLASVLWLPATLARSLSLAIGRPVDDRPVVDALAAMQWTATDEQDRERALRALVERYEGRGAPERAWAAAGAVPLEAGELSRLEEEASLAAFRRADRISAERVRRASLSDVAERFEGTSGGARAAERLAELERTGPTRALALPATALASLADRLGVPAHLVDGRHRNGEVEPPGFRLLEDRVTWEVEVDGESSSFEVELDEALAAALEPVVEEWAWRRRAAERETFGEAHEGVPVELRAGVGWEGVSVLPRLLPEVYRGRDREWYQD